MKARGRVFVALAAVCGAMPAEGFAEPPLPEGARLRDLADARGILVGAALKDGFSPAAMGSSAYSAYALVAGREFNFFTPENQHKFRYVQPARGNFTFAVADTYHAFATSAGGRLHGHPMVWYKATNLPDFVLAASTRAELLAIMEEHIDALGSRWGPTTRAWDVVNEAVADGLSAPPTNWRQGLRSLDSDLWRRVIGDDYIELAFRQAASVRARVGANYELLYNDYSTEGLNAKSHAQYLLLQDHLARGVPIDGVGLQMHIGTGVPAAEDLRANLRRLSELGLSLYITELDSETGVDAAGQARQAHRFHRILDIALRNPHLRGVQTWGFTDRYSWMPASGGPLLFDSPAMGNDYAAKPAYYAIQDALAYERRDALVLNGGFESGANNWTPAGGSALRLEALASGAHSGTVTLRVRGRAGEAEGPAQDLLARIRADGAGAGRYLLSGWFRAPAGPMPVRLMLSIADARGVRRRYVVEGQAGASWRRVSGWINVGWFKQLTEAVLSVETPGRTDDFDLDDVSLGDGNLLLNGAQESAGDWTPFGGVTLARDTTDAGRHYGDAGLAVAKRTAAWHGAAQNVLPRLLACGPGVYSLSGYIRPAEAVEAKLTLRLRDAAAAYLHLPVRRSAGAGVWTRIWGDVSVGWNKPPSEALLYAETAAGTSAFSIDDLVFRKIAEPAESRFEMWQALHFTESERAGGASLATADADGDGFANLLEYVWGSDPRRAAGTGAVSHGAELADGRLRIDLRRVLDPAVSVQPEGSADLKTWTSVRMDLQTAPASEEGFEIWRFVEPFGASSQPRRFYRLRVSLGPTP